MKFRELEVAGVALEYTVVERETLATSPIAERLLGPEGVLELGPIACSTAPVPYALALKTNGRVASLAGLVEEFQSAVRELNARLGAHGAMLLPGGLHPFSDPDTETRRRPRGLCVSLIFRGDAELARVRTALRALSPILPALSASSPIANGAPTGLLATSLEPLDEAPGAANHSSLEMPVLDLAECPAADLAIAQAVVAAVQTLCEGTLSSRADQERLPTDKLAELQRDVTLNGERAQIRDKQILRGLGFPRDVSDEPTARDVWSHLIEASLGDRPDHLLTRARLDVIQREGPLARRILESGDLRETYRKLARCLAEGRMLRAPALSPPPSEVASGLARALFRR